MNGHRLLILFLLGVFLIFPSPSEAGVLKRAGRVVKSATCLALSPIVIPLDYTVRASIIHICYARGDYRYAAWVASERIWDWILP